MKVDTFAVIYLFRIRYHCTYVYVSLIFFSLFSFIFDTKNTNIINANGIFVYLGLVIHLKDMDTIWSVFWKNIRVYTIHVVKIYNLRDTSQLLDNWLGINSIGVLNYISVIDWGVRNVDFCVWLWFCFNRLMNYCFTLRDTD